EIQSTEGASRACDHPTNSVAGGASVIRCEEDRRSRTWARRNLSILRSSCAVIGSGAGPLVDRKYKVRQSGSFDAGNCRSGAAADHLIRLRRRKAAEGLHKGVGFAANRYGGAIGTEC